MAFTRLAAVDVTTRNAAQAVALLAEALALTVQARVCRRLLALSENRKEVRVTQDDLAKTLGIARPTLSRCLKDLEERAALRAEYGQLTILDKSILHSFLGRAVIDWRPQAPQPLFVAISRRRRHPDVYDFTLHKRPCYPNENRVLGGKP